MGISTRSVTLWARKVSESPKLKAQAKAKLEKKPRRSGKKNGVEEIGKLMTENAYLRWWNLGLQQGFIDRLLQDMDMK